MSDGPAVSIVVVSFNTRQMTLECLRSVFGETRDTSFELIVYDNASSDGSADAIAAEFGERVRLLRSAENLGFARANNEAAKLAAGRYLLLLNPDTVVLRGAIDRLVEFARRRPEAGIWGGRTLFADGSLNPTSCWSRQTLWSVLCRASGLSGTFRRSSFFNPEAMGAWERDSERRVDIVTGCFFLIERTMWEKLGGFDPAFFMYGEEADLCLRARRLGVRPMITPDAEIVHYGGASESVKAEKLVRLLRAKAQLIRRHWSPAKAALGIRLLGIWCLNHWLAWSAVSAIRGGDARAVAAREFWGAGWKRRGEWTGEPAGRGSRVGRPETA
ncbi:MAG: glycosyltransferase family 2 protein [Planctomycetota bacterium]|nr:glycosyltransferase family 2 protein [Planctomycetota bacterium]